MANLNEPTPYHLAIITILSLIGLIWFVINGAAVIDSLIPSFGGHLYGHLHETTPEPRPTRPMLTIKPTLFTLTNCDQFCSVTTTQTPQPPTPGTAFDGQKLLLLVYFNTTTKYQIADKIYKLYSSIFKNIAFCGPDQNGRNFWSSVNPAGGLANGNSTFIPYGAFVQNSVAATPYLCLPFAVNQMQSLAATLSGVLVAPSDSLILHWNIKAKNRSMSHNWMTKGNFLMPFDIDTVRFCSGSSPNNYLDCSHGNATSELQQSKSQVEQFYRHLSRLFTTSYFESNILGSEFAHPNRPANDWLDYWFFVKRSLEQSTGGARRLFASSDSSTFYVAQEHIKNVTPLLEIFGRHQVPTNIAVPTTLRIVTYPVAIEYLQMASARLNITQSDVVQPFDWEQISIVKRKSALPKSPMFFSPCIYCQILLGGLPQNRNTHK